MILVLEDDESKPGCLSLRIVTTRPGESHNIALTDVRVRLRIMMERLPSDIRNIPICEMPRRRSTDAKAKEEGKDKG